MRVCCENGKPLCEMPTLDKLACRHDNCTGPVELEDYLLSSHGTFNTNDCTSTDDLCKLLKTKEDYYDSVKNYNYQASLNLEGYTTDWEQWIRSQIEQEGVEKYKSWFARMNSRCDLHIDLIEAHNKLFGEKE